MSRNRELGCYREITRRDFLNGIAVGVAGASFLGASRRASASLPADYYPPALTGLRWFGVVQYIGAGRTDDWTTFYQEFFGFRVLPEDERYGILPKGRILQSPCRKFFLQLVEPRPDNFDLDHEEMLQRVGLGTPDVLRTVAALRERGVGFIESQAGVHPEPRGALTQGYLGGVMFELVHDERP